MSDISNSFDTRTQPIIRFFQEPGLGFYIPLYQRDYSWDVEHIEQLMEDICQGVTALVEKHDDTRFLGTIIVVTEHNKQANIRPQEKEALPTRIDNIIDGQQRISTLAMLATLLYQKLYDLSEQLSQFETFSALQDVFTERLSELKRVFVIDLGRGTPDLKPIVVSASSEDTWTLSGNDSLYRSDVSNYIAKVIRAIHDNSGEFPRISSVSGKRVRGNLQLMKKCIDEVQLAHLPTNSSSDYEFPSAYDILSSIKEEFIWIYDRPELKQIILDTGINGPEKTALCSLVQVSAFCHYVLNCCCFITIQPTNDEWAFDMFQSLNGTGTALTAIETFKATVVHQIHPSYKESQERGFFNKVDELLGQGDTAPKKNTLTNDLLTTFAHAYSGKKLSRHFSKQKRWLDSQYRECCLTDEGERFVERISHVATFLRHLNEYDPAELPYFRGLSAEVTENERKLATFCLLFLRDANHKMARTILSIFYSRILDGCPGSTADFVEATKAVAAFFTLWRSATSTSRLDDTYRTMLRGDDGSEILPLSWAKDRAGDNLSVSNLKSYLCCLLSNRVKDADNWQSSATAYLHYENNIKAVCKFALFITSNDVIPDSDPNNAGLMIPGRPESTKNYLVPDMWAHKSFSLEHIAPRKRASNPPQWKHNLYADENIHKIGNLTLLPLKINQSVGNKSWAEKWIYYKYLAERDPAEVEELKQIASQRNIELNENSVQLLQETPVNDHMAPIIKVGIDGKWDKDLVQKRTERLCSILWKRLYTWLQ